MTLQEMRPFMEEIKAFYPKDFIYDDYLPRQWVTQLKDYSLLNAKKDFERHRNGSMKEKAPTLTYFVKCYENSINKKPGQYYCRYCKKNYKTIEEVHACQDLCRSKKYIEKISNILELNIEEIFGTTILTKEILEMKYNRFMYEAFLKQEETKKLTGYEAFGLKQFYEKVLKPKSIERKEELNV